MRQRAFSATSALRLLLVLTTLAGRASGRVLSECEAVRELQRAGVSRSLISNWVCLMRSESGLDTRLVTGPRTAASYSYGVFQISSGRWCTRGRRGGLCNKRCEDFADDDIQDDIACARRIYDTDGFKAWDGWTKRCKSKPLPNIGNCRRR